MYEILLMIYIPFTERVAANENGSVQANQNEIANSPGCEVIDKGKSKFANTTSKRNEKNIGNKYDIGL
jgi:hypothetical protein